jgi:hypothetical protein
VTCATTTSFRTSSACSSWMRAQDPAKRAGVTAPLPLRGTGYKLIFGSPRVANTDLARSGLSVLGRIADEGTGAQSLTLSMGYERHRCEAGTCSVKQSTSAPLLEWSIPKRAPGESAPRNHNFAHQVDLEGIFPTSVPPGVSYTVILTIHATGKNHLDGQATTPRVIATWRFSR